MRRCLLPAVLLLATGPAFAQTVQPVSPLDSLLAASAAQAQVRALQAQALAATDTVGALHRMFAARRERRNLLAIGTVLTTTLSVAVANSSSGTRSGSDYTGLLSAIFVVFVAGPVLAADLIYPAQYTHIKERRAVEAFENHQLPDYLKSQLKGRYFLLPKSAVIQ